MAIPSWEKNVELSAVIEKGYRAQQKLLAKLQGDGASRPWLDQRFAEIDKAVAAGLTTVAERIRTRRWCEKESSDAMQRLQAAFRDLEHWASKTVRYCERAGQGLDSIDRETVLDAACLGILKVGEIINRVERMQHGFWIDFRAAHYLQIRGWRNLIGHTDDLRGEQAIPLGTGIVRELHAAVQRTRFPETHDSFQNMYIVSAKEFRKLEPGDTVETSSSIAMIRVDEHGRFAIFRMGRSEENQFLLSASAPVKGSVTLYHIPTDS
ncbi:MAG: hypothetical protein OXL41_04730 [Nitrospinae bacterium]|nr:hypothetical protein [Nitrospinota bacterium]